MNIVNIKKVLKISLEILRNLLLNPSGKKLVLNMLETPNMAKSLDDFAKNFETLNLDESAHVVEINPHQITDTGATGSSKITVNAVNGIVEQTMNNILNRLFTSLK